MFTWLFNLFNNLINYLNICLYKCLMFIFYKYNDICDLYQKLTNDNISEFINYLDKCIDKCNIREFYKHNDKNVKIYSIHNNIICSFSPNDGIKKYNIDEIEYLIKYGFFKDGTKIPFESNDNNNFDCVFTSVKQFVKYRYHMDIDLLLFNDEYFISDKLVEYYNNYILTNNYDEKYIEALRNKNYLELNMNKLSGELYTESNGGYNTISKYSLHALEMIIYENDKELINKLKSLKRKLNPLIQDAIDYQDSINKVNPIIKNNTIKFFDILSQKMDKFDDKPFKNQIAVDI